MCGKAGKSWPCLGACGVNRRTAHPATGSRRTHETTPERALRKMVRTVKTLITNASRGEHERILARHDGGAHTPAAGGAADSLTAPGQAVPTPAIDRLDGPIVLARRRAAYVCLASCELHYCRNCDEEWPAFTAEWPQGGVATAGRRAGQRETITRAGYAASPSRPGYCSRCDASSAYRAMHCQDNLQHLGPRHEALSNLT